MRNEQFMLFQTQKRKIQQHLNTLTGDMSAFDELLNDYVNGDFKARFISLGVTDIKIHIDWHDNYKCIELQGKYLKKYVDLQIEQTEFGIAIDPIEPDIEENIPLESKEMLYSICEEKFSKI